MSQNPNEAYPGGSDSWIEKIFQDHFSSTDKAKDEFAKKLLGKSDGENLNQLKSGEGLNQLKSETYTDLEKPKILSFSETFNGYMEFVKSMKVYPEKHAIVYPALGIAGEGGEVAEKVKKWLRGDKELDMLELLKEAGDVLWYLASLADDLGYTFQDMVDENVKKLSSRKERGVQKGDGDNR